MRFHISFGGVRTTGLVAVLLCLAFAADVSAQSAGAFTRMGFGARGMGLGNALVADRHGDTSPFYNPALAPHLSGQQLELSAAIMRFDRQLQALHFAAPLRPRAGVAAGLLHAGVGNIDGRDNNGFHTESLSTDQFAFFLAFGLKVTDRVSGGLSLQLFRSDLFDGLRAENTVGLDVGVSAEVTDALSVGLVVDDLLARFEYDTSGLFGGDGGSTTDDFPARVRLGAAYTLLGDRARVFAEYESRVERLESRRRRIELVGGVPIETFVSEELSVQSSYLRFGAEYELVDRFKLRGGVDQFGSEGFGESRPSAGFTLVQPVGGLTIHIEYGFLLEPFAVGTLHVLSLRLYL